MADTVGMTLVLKADAKGVVAEMKNAQGAVIDTARIMRSQLKTASEDSAGGLAKMKEQMGRARETAMFFTNSLTALGPAGQTAQTALAGIGGAIMGGGGILAGLSLAKVAVELLSDAWSAEAKAAEAARDKNVKAAKDIADAAAASATARQKQVEDLYYTRDLQLKNKFREDLKQINEQIAEARKRTGDDVQSQEVKDLIAQRQRLTDAYNKERESIKLLDDAEKAKKKAESLNKAIAKEKTPEQLAADRQKETNEYMAGIRDQLKADEEAASERGRIALAEQQADQNRVKKMEEAAAQVKAEWSAAGATISGAMGDIGNIIGGAASSWMQYFGQLIQKAIQLGIAMAATAGPFGWLNAAAAGIALISAVTSVPEFRALGGPVAAGSPYIVGERGPELFVPTQSGGIVPNNALGGGLTINISAVNSKDVRRLFLDNQAALAEAIGKAVRDGRRMA